jgi:hypothetical protein
MALLTNIRLRWKGTSTLAYYKNSYITDVKSLPQAGIHNASYDNCYGKGPYREIDRIISSRLLRAKAPPNISLLADFVGFVFRPHFEINTLFFGFLLCKYPNYCRVSGRKRSTLADRLEASIDFCRTVDDFCTNIGGLKAADTLNGNLWPIIQIFYGRNLQL